MDIQWISLSLALTCIGHIPLDGLASHHVEETVDASSRKAAEAVEELRPLSLASERVARLVGRAKESDIGSEAGEA